MQIIRRHFCTQTTTTIVYNSNLILICTQLHAHQIISNNKKQDEQNGKNAIFEFQFHEFSTVQSNMLYMAYFKMHHNHIPRPTTTLQEFRPRCPTILSDNQDHCPVYGMPYTSSSIYAQLHGLGINPLNWRGVKGESLWVSTNRHYACKLTELVCVKFGYNECSDVEVPQ